MTTTSRVLVTGMGVISCIGKNAAENFSNLVAEKSGIGKLELLQTQHRGNLPAGEIKYTNEELGVLAGITNLRYFSRTTLLAFIAAQEAIKHSGIQKINEFRTGLISSSTVGGMDKSENFFPLWLKKNPRAKLSDIITHDCGDSTNRLAEFLGIQEYVSTISTACSSSANAIMLGARLIKSNRLDRVIVGGTDALSRFTLNGFNTLLILDKENVPLLMKTVKDLTLGKALLIWFWNLKKQQGGKKFTPR